MANAWDFLTRGLRQNIRQAGDIASRYEHAFSQRLCGPEATVLLKVPRFYAAAHKQELAWKLRAQGETHAFTHLPYLALTTDARHAQRIIDAKRAHPSARSRSALGIIGAYLSKPRYLPLTRKGRGGEDLWNIPMIGADQVQVDASGCRVAVVDTGIADDHPDLQSRCAGGFDFVYGNNPYDGNGHGTHVAGIIAGANTGVSNATLLSYRVLDERGMGDEAGILKALDKAIDERVDVINMSLGSPQGSVPEEDACMACLDHGIVVVAAAGNESYGYSYPASYPSVVSVAAVDKRKQHAYFSNVNELVDMAAPGVDVYSTYPGGYETLSGTSMASPHVAGCFAIAKSVAAADPTSLEQSLESVAEQRGDPREYGSGIVRIDRFVRMYLAIKDRAAKRRSA